MSTYQAASGAGAEGIKELREGSTSRSSVFPHPLPYNVIPRIDVVEENGYTGEEMKVGYTRNECSLIGKLHSK